MFRSKTVLILGAGSSCELGFPDGAKLLSDIASGLDIRFRDYSQEAGSRQLFEAFKRHHRARSDDVALDSYLSAAWRLRDAAAIARSIDNAIDQNDDDPLLATVGKLAIGYQIGLEEDGSHLTRRQAEPHVFELEPLAETWLLPFGQALTTDVRKSGIDTIFENLAVISFNYDRSFEAFLPTILHSVYGLHPQDAQKVAARLRVHHPYGSLGPLPWQSPEPGSIEYGAFTGIRLTNMPKRFVPLPNKSQIEASSMSCVGSSVRPISWYSPALAFIGRTWNSSRRNSISIRAAFLQRSTKSRMRHRT